MAILSDIWSVLITENGFLTRIFTAPTVFIETLLIFQLFTSILKISYSRVQKKIYIVIFSLTSLTTEWFILSPFNVLLNFLILFILIKILFKLNIIKTILAMIIPIVIFALVSTIVLNPFLKLFNITSTILNNTPIYKLTYLIACYVVIFILWYLLHFKNYALVLLEDFNKKNKAIITMNLLLGMITLCTQAILTYYYVTNLPIFVTILNFVLLLAYFLISFYSLTRIMKLQITTRELENAENYNNTLSYLYDNVKAFKHDFNNIIFIIGGFVNNNDIDGLKKYYTDLEKDCIRVNSIEILNPKIINNPGIYNLLVAKYNKAEKANVKISLEFFFDLEKLHMPIYEFARVLGILLDNSIEAASECAEKSVNIMFRDSSRHCTQIIKIENTYNNTDVDILKIFEKGVSEKKEHMGMGLWEVNQIIKRNNNIKLITSKNEKYFVQQLEIYY